MSQRVFISHSSKDQKIAETICLALESRGIECWLASRDVNPGENFMQAIVSAIRAAKIMVLVFTSHANESDEIKKELALASQYRLVIIPVRAEDVLPNDALAYQFAISQWIDLFKDWERQIERLTSRISGLLPIDPPKLSEPKQPPLHSLSAAVAAEAPGPEHAEKGAGLAPPQSPIGNRLSKSFAQYWRELGRRKRSLLLIGALFVALSPFMWVPVPTGHVGVLWKRFNTPGLYCWCILSRGTVLNPEEIRGEGLHIIWPWDELFIYDLRLQSTTETYNARSRDGVSLAATIIVRTQLNYAAVPVLHKFIGPAYIQRVVMPEIGSVARDVISQFDAEQVYSTTKRLEIPLEIRSGTRAKLNRELTALMQPEASEQIDAADVEYRRRLQSAILIVDTLVSIDRPK